MREFIDIITSKFILNETFLVEAKNYYALINTIEKWMTPEGRADHVKFSTLRRTVDWAVKTLKTDPRITWYLRFAILEQFDSLISHEDKEMWIDSQAAKNAFDQYLADMMKLTGKSADVLIFESSYKVLDRCAKQLEHFLSLPAPTIQNCVFSNQTPTELIAFFRKCEENWQEKLSRLIPYSPEPIVLEFPDGFKWVHLDREQCNKEGSAMGHCGNAGNPRNGDTILSLRRIVQDGQYWEPSLTFILDHHGYIGEMKGRGNNKPAAKYFPHIIALLKLPMVKGIKGGGYLSQNNFSLDDLPSADKKKLLDEKPALGTLMDQFKREGLSGGVCERVKISLENLDIEYVGFAPENTKVFYIQKFDSWTDVIKEYGDNNAKNVLGSVEEGYDYDHGVTNDEIKDLFSGLSNKIIENIAKYLIKHNPDEVSEWEANNSEKFDPETVSDNDIFDVLAETQNDVWNALDSGVRHGYQVGLEKEMMNYLTSSLNNIEILEQDIGYVTTEGPENDLMWDRTAYIAVQTQNLIRALDRFDIPEYGMADVITSPITVEEPHYGFHDYDAKAAEEYFLEEAPGEIRD